jgi:hypothetical protein
VTSDEARAATVLAGITEVDNSCDLVAAVLPVGYDELWRALVAADELSDALEGRLWDLEAWVESSEEDR